jgi:uncharacterized protein YdeI (YjbR/CyaY-like superfamily)
MVFIIYAAHATPDIVASTGRPLAAYNFLGGVMELLRAANRAAWRRWLRANYRTTKEIWLVNPHKNSGETAITYNDAVEEALCFGWIDSNVKNLDAGHSAQKYTPRKKDAAYSQANIERLKLLSKLGKLAPEIKRATAAAVKRKFIFPADITAALQRSRIAWANFKEFPPAYQRIRVAFVEGARRRPAVFRTRLKYLVKMCEKNRMFGYGGIEKYFKEN